MQHDPVVAMAYAVQAALRASQDAEDREDAPEADKHGRRWASLLYAEREMAPTSNADAGQKMRNIAADVRRESGASGERVARSAIRIAAKIEQGDGTVLTLRALRALMPAALRHDCEVDGAAMAKALTHAINWCARLRLV
jgi:hypothetical protein